MKKIYLLIFLLIGMLGSAMAQGSSVTGKITQSSDGKLLNGVNVQVKGSENKVLSDVNGTFSIQCNQNDTLVFSLSGLKTAEVAVNGQATLTIVLDEESATYKQHVVTGFGIKRSKAELGYSSQKVSASEITTTRSNNALSALSGKVAGLDIKTNNQMGGSTNIVLRGFKSLAGNNQALIVIDGVPFDNSNTNGSGQATARGGYDFGNAAADINPDDIASINVLKGAAATALYGSRAANGVILIETKKGRRGVNVTVNMGGSYGVIDKTTMPQYQNQYGAGYGPFYGDTLGGYYTEDDIDGDGKKDVIVNTTEDASFGGKFDPNLKVFDWKSLDPTDKEHYMKATSWVAAQNTPAYFMRNPSAGSKSFSIYGGNDKSTYKLGFARNTEQGMLPNSSLFKNILNFGVTNQLTNKLYAGITANISFNGATGRYGTGYDAKNPMGNFRQWWQTNVDMKELEAAYNRNTERNTTWNWADYTDVSAGPIYWDNPYFMRNKSYENDERTRFFGNTFLTYQAKKWMTITGRVSMDGYNEMQEERIAVGSIDVSEYSRYNRNYREFNYDLFAEYNKEVSKNFKISGVSGINIRKQTITSIYAQTNGGLNVPNLYSLSNTVNPLEAPSESYSAKQVNGVYSNVNVGYKNFLFIDLTGRNDVSSTLSKGSNSYFYPSISGSYIFADHLKKLIGSNMKWLSYSKFRANYAQVGSDAPYGSTKNYYSAGTGFNGNAIYSVSSVMNSAGLQPEKTKSREIGIEVSLLKNRVGFDFNNYNAVTVNQIIPVDISRATGYSQKFINAGAILNRGIEMTLYLNPIRNKNFNWDINFNWARNRNKVLELPDIENITLANLQGGVSVNATVGQAYGTIKGKDFIYDDKGNRMIDTNTGYWMVTSTSNNVIGNINPKWIGGMRNSFKYKNMSFSFLIDMKKGGSVFSLDQFYGYQTGIYDYSVGKNDLGNDKRLDVAEGGGVILDGVKPDGSKNDIRVNYDYFLGNAMAPSYFVYNAGYVKLRELTFGYSVPQKYLSKFKTIKGIDVSLFGRNLWIIKKYVPFSDPEDGMSSGNIQGYQSGAYPNTKMYGFNVRFNF